MRYANTRTVPPICILRHIAEPCSIGPSGRRSRHCPTGPNPEKVDTRIERHPEASAGFTAHITAHHRFAGIERIADRLCIQNDLK